MFLARCVHECRGDVVADMLRYYSLDLAGRFDVFAAAECAARLPLGSNVARVLSGGCTYTTLDFLVHALIDGLARKHLPYPWERAGAGEDSPLGDLQVMGVEEFDRWLLETQWEEGESDVL